MIIIVSNREIDPTRTDENLFGNGVSSNGAEHLRVATAEFANDAWSLSLIPEDTTTTSPSQDVFNTVVSTTDVQFPFNSGLVPHWLVYVHGFNKDMRDLLDECRELEDEYKVNVLAFAWPSNPSENTFKVLSELRKAEAIAQDSALGFNRFLSKLNTYYSRTDRAISLTLMCHSLGNFLFESWMRNSASDLNTLSIFKHVILHQAAVKAASHKDWLDNFPITGPSLVITLNNRDQILAFAKAVNGKQLGQLDSDFTIQNPVYLNFTDEPHIGDTHNLFRRKNGFPAAIANSHLHTFARQAFKGLDWTSSVANFSFERDSDHPNVWKPKHVLPTNTTPTGRPGEAARR